MPLKAEVDFSAVEVAVRKSASTVVKHLRIALINSLSTVQVRAKGHHRFVSDSGDAERAISQRVNKGSLTGEVFIDSNAPGYYATFLNNGAKPHQIKAKNKKSLYWVAGGEKVFYGAVWHPGIKGEMFLESALTAEMPKIQTMVTEALQRGLDEAGF